MGGGGGSSPEIIAPAPPPSPPSLKQQVTEFAEVAPKLVELEREFGPQFAQIALDQFQKFAPDFTRAAYDISEELFPYTTGLQEQIAQLASERMNEPLPKAIADQYVSDFNAGIGVNANAPLGVSTRNRGLMQMQEDWRRYYQNLGLTTTGRQPLQQAFLPQMQSPTAGFGLPQAIQNSSNLYSTYANAVANQQLLAMPRGGGGGFNVGGSAMGALGGAAAGAYVGSTLFPGVGTAVGAIGGGLLGGVGGGFA